MQCVVTLVGDSWLNKNIIADISRILARNPGVKWLAKNKAVDVFFSGEDLPEIKKLIARYLGDKRVDFSVQFVANRRKKLLIADMDSTIVTSETLDELSDYIGIKKKIATITACAMKGEINFHDALRKRVALLKNLPVEALEETYKKINLTAGAKTLIKTMRDNGVFTLLVSGGFDFFTNKISELCGFHHNIANRFEIKNNELTGKVIEPILDGNSKYNALNEYAQLNNIPMELTMAIGDGANDRQMIQGAGFGVGFYAKPILAEEADAVIKYTDLTSLLYMQGYGTHK